MSRSNAPQALSVVNLTIPGDVDATYRQLSEFDERDFGFSHNRTWDTMAHALRGVFDPQTVARTLPKGLHPRIQKCIVALCEEGRTNPRDTKRFKDFSDAGLKAIQSIEWGPNVFVKVKATCWYVKEQRVIIPVLQPRKDAPSDEALGVYMRLVRQAYCQGDWYDAEVELFDLSGEGKVIAAVRAERDIPYVSDQLLSRYIQTYIAAKRLADQKRKSKPKEKKPIPMDIILEP